MKNLFTSILFTILFFPYCKAQFVTIPDSNFANCLKSAPALAPCIVGNQLDTTCPAVLSRITIYCPNKNIINFTGIKYFKHLDTLICYYNNFPTFPTLPASLRYINCRYSGMTSLDNLPDSLEYMDCSGNYGIIKLPPLPHFLQYLDCDFLYTTTQLPALPPTLIALSCNVNALTSLPALPNSLYYLLCSGDSLSSLPELPPYLFYLDCSLNKLTSLPIIPSSMWKLYINNNYGLTCLPELPSMDYFDFVGTAVTCLPNYPQITTCLPALNTLPICDSTFNPNNCALVSSIATVTGVSTFNTYPNPTNDILFISGNFPTGEIDVRDLLGTLLIEQPINSNTRTSSIDISHLAKGIYFVTLYSNNQNITKKIIKD